MADVQWLDYTIFLTDKAQVEELQAAIAIGFNPPNGDDNLDDGEFVNFTFGGVELLPRGNIVCSPMRAAQKYNAPIRIGTDAFSAPCITSPWITIANDANFPVTRDRWETTSGGWFGIGALFGDTKIFRWRGQFAYSSPLDPPVDGEPDQAAIPERIFIEGFEMAFGGEGGSEGGIAPQISRDASRHPDGYGLAIRGQDGVKTQLFPSNTLTIRQRLYIRLRKRPTGTVHFWRIHLTGSGDGGLALGIDSLGRIVGQNIDAFAAVTNLVTATTPLEQWNGDTQSETGWVRLDLISSLPNAGVNVVSVRTAVYQRGALLFSMTGGTTYADTNKLLSSNVGTELSTAARQLGLDIDDWIGTKVPDTRSSLDWVNGSRVVRVEAKEFATSHDVANWAGDWRACRQNPSPDGSEILTTDTSGSRLAVKTNSEAVIDGELGSLGAVALCVGVRTDVEGTADGELGFSINGGAADLDTVVEQNTPKWNKRTYTPADQQSPQDMTPIELYYEKAASSDDAIVYALAAVAELCGIFGFEDVTDDGSAQPKPLRDHLGPHNSPYPNTAWARRGSKPLQPLAVVGMTYVGNDTYQELYFTVPVHWLWIRPVAGTALGSIWSSAHVAAHPMFGAVTKPAAVVAVEIDPDFVADGVEGNQQQRTVVRIVGNDAKWNDSGVTYQVIAFCDPASRNLLNGGLAFPWGIAEQSTPLTRKAFTPNGVFLHREIVGGTSNNNLFYQGPGHTGGAMSQMNDAQVANLLAVSESLLKTQNDVHLTSTGNQVPYSVFRKNDGSEDPGRFNVCYQGSYTGDGSGNRTITFGSGATKFPLFAIVFPHDAACVFRDPTHLGATSTLGDGSAIASTGIRGGALDGLQVGSLLNGNAKVYDVFLFWGDDTGDANGWSGNGEYFPVDPALGPDDPDNDDPTVDDDDLNNIDGTDPDTGGGTGSGGDDLATGCLGATTQICNRALGHIGNTKLLTNLDTNTSTEASQSRLYYADEVDAVLRDFPWAFATKYADPVLVAGSETAKANGDWRYSYRMPSDCLFVRRVIDPRLDNARQAAPDPIAFKVGSDTTGKLIYTNEPDASIEYTYRPACAALAGDAQFRDLLSWRMAAVLAPGCGRNKLTAVDCLSVYRQRLITATTTSANEQQPVDAGIVDPDWITGRG